MVKKMYKVKPWQPIATVGPAAGTPMEKPIVMAKMLAKAKKPVLVVGVEFLGMDMGDGKKLIDYLLSQETESKLAFADGAQIPLRDDVKRPAHVTSYQQVKSMDVDFEEVAQKIEYATKVLQAIYIR